MLQTKILKIHKLVTFLTPLIPFFVRFFLVFLISSCSPPDLPKPKIFLNTQKQLIITSSPNLSYSIIVEILQVSDQQLYDKLSAMSSIQYFQDRGLILENSSVKAWSIQIPPNFKDKFYLSGYSKKSYGVILFAIYHKDMGSNKIFLKKKADLTKIELGPQKIVSAYSGNLSKNAASFKAIKKSN